jgi:predicted nucleic acid-binding protein
VRPVKTYADTSFFFSLYATDSNSARADIWRTANPLPLPFSAFHRLELRNALNLALFQKRLTPLEVQSAWLEVENDFAAGVLVSRGGLWHRVLLEAESLSKSHTSTVGCRTLDILHVAFAKLLGTTEFCTFDSRQSTLAGLAGMTAVSP